MPVDFYQVTTWDMPSFWGTSIIFKCPLNLAKDTVNPLISLLGDLSRPKHDAFQEGVVWDGRSIVGLGGIVALGGSLVVG